MLVGLGVGVGGTQLTEAQMALAFPIRSESLLQELLLPMVRGEVSLPQVKSR